MATGAVRVTVTRRGVTVTAVALPFLRRTVPLQPVVRARDGWARPLQIGGWGYRWLPGLTAVSLREGDALWLELTSGREFVVTVDDAGSAARLVNDFLRSGTRT
ncbi:hypothetical protein ACFP1Z_07055 [Streptomyces gamaensis]|uniref:Bacterial Pleckstrin homology domain-containing protein n=1 Tax=Streptomyces gamaensis TaxID=1763542 RepID=A0ABW0YWM7_9ACTN